MKAIAGFVIARIEVMPGMPDWLRLTSEGNWSLPVPTRYAPQLHVGMSLDVEITVNSDDAPQEGRQ